MLLRFDSAETERAYVTHERAARIPGTRFLAAMGILTLITYMGFNPMHFPREGVLEYNIAAGLMIAILLGFVGATFTRFYIERGWVDVLFFTALAGAMILLLEALAAQSAITGISRFGMAIVSLAFSSSSPVSGSSPPRDCSSPGLRS